MKNKSFSAKGITFYPYIILFLGALLVLLTSPLAPFAHKLTNSDSGVYVYCAEQILNGKIMYQEIFDHKGPVFYLFLVVGLLIGGGNSTGIWFVELVVLFVSLIFIFKSLTLYFDKFIALVSTLTCLILFSTFLEEGRGNTTEEYAMLFISIAMYYFLRFFKNRNLKIYPFAIIALCFICTFLIKPNFIPLWITGYLFVFIRLLNLKEIKKIIPIAVISLLTVTGVCLPFVLYFVFTDSWLDFKFCFWDFNKAYSDNISLFGILLSTCKRLWFEPVARTPFQVFLFLFFAGVIIRFRHLQYKTETWFFICTILLTGILISIGSFVFAHYFLLFVPIFAFPYAAVYHFMKKNFAGESKWIYCFFIVLLVCGGVNDLKMSAATLPYKKHTSVENLVSFIQKNTEETDKITVVGNDCWIYILSGRESVSKYMYQFPPVTVQQYGTMMAETYMKDIENGKPRMIITRLKDDQRKYLPELNEVLDTQYERAASADIPDWNIYCWLRKP